MNNIQQIIKSSKFIPNAKELLKQDCLHQLEGTYGLLQNGLFEDISHLPTLKAGSPEYKIRSEIERLVKHETESGFSAESAVEKLSKEYAFTYLNRFVAFKMMEDRKIVRQMVSGEFNSNAFKFYMADNPDDEKLWRQGKVYEAYKHFIQWHCDELSKDDEIKILFDPNTLISKLFPQERTLKALFALINDDTLADVWQEDEVIGWVYQYFIEDEKDAVFDKIYKQKKKMDLTDIPAATQIFTPKWIVKFLVENTLGRLWIRMHPDTKIKDEMEYYVPNDNDKESIPLKPVKEITLLDPACGTMHFGMVAFDLLYDMYIEEMEKTGKKGWLQNPSLTDRNTIPSAIIENNIYGIDLDLRAIQLSALTLYLKAKSKSKNKNVSINKYNLTHTDIPAFSDETINEFVDSLSSNYQITKKLFRKILPQLNKAYYLGSLLKIEDIIKSFLHTEKQSIENKYHKQQELFMEMEERQLFLEEGKEWNDIKEEVLTALDEFIEKANGHNDNFVAVQSKSGISLINSLMRKHDVVACNPPYSGRRNMNTTLRNDLKDLYPKKDGDFYTAFINRCLELTASEYGFCGMVTVHSFMFTSSHEEIRKEIIETTEIETMAHLGTRTEFDVANKTAQGFSLYSMGKIPEERQNVSGVYFRLVQENEEEKHEAFVRARKDYVAYPDSFSDPHVFVLDQEKLKSIPSWPFVYWISDRIRDLFVNLRLLESYAKPCQGIATADNNRFLRLWWEVGCSNTYFSCPDHYASKQSGKKWFPYMKGGEVSKWYGNQEYLVNWFNDGYEIKNFFKNGKLASRPQNLEYSFQEGATYSFLTVSNLSVRYLPKGFIFDVAGSSIFPQNTNVHFMLGILNSKITTFLIKVLNPTVNYQVGDIARIPYPDEQKNKVLSSQVENNVKLCIELKQDIVKEDELSWEFVQPPEWKTGLNENRKTEKQLAELETSISEEIYTLYDIHGEDIEQIENEYGKLPAHFPKISDLEAEELKIIDSLYLEKHIPSEALKQNDTNSEEEDDEDTDDSGNSASKGRGRQKRFLTFEEICLAAGFHPETVFNYIKENNLERPEERYELAVRWISYCIGIIMGRYEKEGILPDDDGICVLDEGHPDDLPAQVNHALEVCLGSDSAREVLETIGGDLRKFLEREFFSKWHIPMYKKRPVYWLLQTVKKNYGFYIYNQKFTKDTLYSLSHKYIEPKIQLVKNKITELAQRAENAESRLKRELLNEIGKHAELLTELDEFNKNIQEVIDMGFQPDIDDGVILNMAPLYKLIPWKEPEKYYKELNAGKYEWASVSRFF